MQVSCLLLRNEVLCFSWQEGQAGWCGYEITGMLAGAVSGSSFEKLARMLWEIWKPFWRGGIETHIPADVKRKKQAGEHDKAQKENGEEEETEERKMWRGAVKRCMIREVNWADWDWPGRGRANSDAQPSAPKGWSAGGLYLCVTEIPWGLSCKASLLHTVKGFTQGRNFSNQEFCNWFTWD